MRNNFRVKMFCRENDFIKKVFVVHNTLLPNCIKMHIYQSFSTFQRTLIILIVATATQ